MDLNEIIAGDAPELTKIAGIASAYVAGEISAEEGNDIAVSVNINPDRVKDFVIAHQYDLEKEAAEAEPTHLEKIAHIVDDFYAGELSEADLEKIASEHGLAMRDIQAIAGMAYSEEFEGDYELSKEAQLEEAQEVLDDDETSYIQKTASIAALVANEVISEADAYEAAAQFGIYGNDLEFELSKTAGRVGDAVDSVRNFVTGNKKARIEPKNVVSEKAPAYGPKPAPKERSKMDAAKTKTQISTKKFYRKTKKKAEQGAQWARDNKGKATAIGGGLLATGAGGTYYATRD